MKRSKLRRSVVTGLTAVTLTTALMGDLKVHAENQDAAPHPAPEWFDEQWRNAVYVSFEDLQVSLTAPPRLVGGVMMVQARALLEGLGYSLTWDANTRSIAASHEKRAFLTFKEDSLQSPLGSQISDKLPEAPFIEDGTMWIPLRAAAVAAGLSVQWDERGRLALVSDPNAIPKFRVMTQVTELEVETPSVFLKHMEEQLKSDVEISWVPPDYYREKTMVMIAAGDMADLTLFNDPYMLNDEIMESVVMDLSGYLPDYPALQKLASSHAGTRVINDHSYAIPRLSDAHNAAFPSVRKDWLDRFGLTVPQTMDELYEVMKVFAKNDPDGDGKTNTWGLVGGGNRSLSWVEHAFTGSPERFSIRDGKIIDHAVSPQETESLQWLARAYKDGLVDPDFAVMSSDQAMQKLEDGKAGLAALTIDEAAGLTKDKAIWLPLPALKANASSAPIAPWASTGAGAYTISRMTKDDLAVILNWLEYGMKMTKEDKWSETDGWSPADQAAVHSLFGQPDMLKNNDQLDKLPSQIKEQYVSAVERWRTVSYEDQLLPEASVVWSSGNYSEMNQQLEQKKNEFIVGQITLEQWNSFIQDMVKSQAYKEMMVELEALLASRS